MTFKIRRFIVLSDVLPQGSQQNHGNHDSKEQYHHNGVRDAEPVDLMSHLGVKKGFDDGP